MGASSPAMIGGGSQLEPQNAASTATRKDKRAHKGRRQMEDSFMIHLYKVKMCTRSTPHNWKLCPWAHPGEAAARRHPSCHQAELCHAMGPDRECPHGETCAWARNIFEAHLHPDRYRTVMCAMGEGCGRNICFFAHNEQELRTPPTLAM
ncbi:hypothetical protein OEZ86_006628 [Tetradesmus obliquus]|uniref:AtC3H23-like CCCH zinc finger domain-containing protein n=1 Tax=Tetradesmus obliquus TaxID=3088 RepID=A0ABY8TW29_TETOB|nr:hypothetical protein OEZ85_006939 [Tetradesmus obliquus]WIA33502.1 hypothetical protein OEZ86_006628 [Tetradesmus obliquus]